MALRSSTAWASSWLVEIPKGRPGPSREAGGLFATPPRAPRSCLVEAVEKAECEDRHSLVLHPHEVSGIPIGMALLIQCPRQCLRRTQQLRSGLRFKAQPRRLRQAIDNLNPELGHVLIPGCAPRCSVPPVSCWRETQRDWELRPVPTLERLHRAGRVAQRWLGLSASDAPLRNPPRFQAPVGCCDGSHAGRSGLGLWLVRAPSCAGAVCSRKPQAFRSPHPRNTSSAPAPVNDWLLGRRLRGRQPAARRARSERPLLIALTSASQIAQSVNAQTSNAVTC